MPCVLTCLYLLLDQYVKNGVHGALETDEHATLAKLDSRDDTHDKVHGHARYVVLGLVSREFTKAC